MFQYVPGQEGESGLFKKLGLPFGRLSGELSNGKKVSALILTQHIGNTLIDELLQGKDISAVEAETLKGEISKQGLGVDSKAIVERARTLLVPDDHSQKVTFVVCQETGCIFKLVGLTHAWTTVTESDRPLAPGFSVEEIVTRLFIIDRREGDKNPLGPNDAIRIIVEAADQGLLLEMTDVTRFFQELKGKNPLGALLARELMKDIQFSL